MKRIIVFHISEFGGHSKAAHNIKEALLFRSPNAEVLTLNGFGYFYPWSEKIVDFIYATTIRYFPHIWGRVYDRKHLVRKLSPFRRWINQRTFAKLSKLIKEFNPECVVATQAFPCGIVADFKEQTNLKIPLVAVVTDYYPHRFWTHPAIDKYVVACPDAREILIGEGVTADKIEILGIPISIKFLKTYPKNETAGEFGFSDSLPTVIIMGGGWGFGPIEKIATELDYLNADFQIIAICGKNKKLHNWFARHKDTFRKKLFCFGYTESVHKMMDFADIIITKGGGITISEALAKGLCIITAHSIPGQEERNVNYLGSRGAIINAPDISSIIDAVRVLLTDHKKFYELKTKAREVSCIDSSLRIADLILQRQD